MILGIAIYGIEAMRLSPLQGTIVRNITLG